MEHATIAIIRTEHHALRRVLDALVRTLTEHKSTNAPLDFAAMRAMLFYLSDFPERLHHKEESSLLFPRLRLRSPRLHGVLDRLDREHEQGRMALLELEHELLAFEMVGKVRRDDFEQALRRYVDFYSAHMRVEETEVLPLAEAVFTQRDWAELDTVFSLNHDPLTGYPPTDEYSVVFDKIASAISAPNGRR
jgi:hemerythrin-like domain-containing protein